MNTEMRRPLSQLGSARSGDRLLEAVSSFATATAPSYIARFVTQSMLLWCATPHPRPIHLIRVARRRQRSLSPTTSRNPTRWCNSTTVLEAQPSKPINASSPVKSEDDRSLDAPNHARQTTENSKRRVYGNTNGAKSPSRLWLAGLANSVRTVASSIPPLPKTRPTADVSRADDQLHRSRPIPHGSARLPALAGMLAALQRSKVCPAF